MTIASISVLRHNLPVFIRHQRFISAAAQNPINVRRQQHHQPNKNVLRARDTFKKQLSSLAPLLSPDDNPPLLPCGTYRVLVHRNTLECQFNLQQNIEETLMGNGNLSRFRQPPPPPPPPRRCSERSLSKREGNTSIVRRPYLFRRCKKVPASSIESLPDELLSEILARVSADDICANAMVVCRKWYQIIHSGDDFINAHRSNSDCGLLLTTCYNISDHPLFLGVRQGRIEISYKLFQKSRIQISASCNGLVLWLQPSTSGATIYILNLATKQPFSIPPSHSNTIYAGYQGIAYAAASMVYKVVRSYSRGFIRFKCDILTVGVDNSGWRSCTGVDNLSFFTQKLLLDVPLITQGFMHWTSLYEETPKVLTLNVETEIFTESCCVQFCGRGRMCFLSTGRRLSLLSACGDWMWEVWEMEESGDWRKFLPNIDLEAHKSRIEQEKTAHDSREFIIPLGWIKYPVLLALRLGGGLSRTCFVYNLDTDEIDSIELPHPCVTYRALLHRNTLEWLS